MITLMGVTIPQWLIYAIGITLLFFFTSCATARVNQFHNFAQEGTAYVEASQTVLEQAGSAAIDADSLIALSIRDALKTADDRRKAIVSDDEALRKQLALLQQIGEHGKLLGSYFDSLAELSDPQAPAGLETATQGLYGSLLTLSPALENGSLGGENIQNKIPQAADFIVDTFDARALDGELKLRAKAIERELALQEAAFTVIADNLKTNLAVRLNLQETQDVINPYAAAGKVPAEWASRRQDILKARVSADGALSALEAAKRLRADFVALMENRLSPEAILKTIRSIHSIQDLKDQIQKATHS